MKNQIGVIIKKMRIEQGLSQQSLCKEICSVSYLSKIENLDAEANKDMICALVRKLGYEYFESEKHMKEFQKVNVGLWNQFLEFEQRLDAKVINTAIDSRIRFSPLAVDYYLIRSLAELLENKLSLNSLNFLQDCSDVLTERQQYLLDVLTLNLKVNENMPLVNKDLKIKDNFGNVAFLIASTMLRNGEYQKAIRFGTDAYDMFSEKGNIRGMLYSGQIRNKCYLNLFDLSMQIEETQRILRINRFINDSQVEINSYFNLGYAYLSDMRPSEALPYFLQAKRICDRNDELYFEILEKLILTHIQLKQFDLAKHLLNEVRPDNFKSHVYNLISLMLKDKDYINNPLYIQSLERIIEAAKDTKDSRKQFYSKILYHAYKKNYNYNKALKVLETLN